MIENETQLKISKDWIKQFSQEISDLQGQEQDTLTQATINALKSELIRMCREVADYELKKENK